MTDLMLEGATRAAGVSPSGAAALLALRAEPGLGVTELGRRVGLTQSAAARMVDSLAAAGLVGRHDATARSVSVRLTTAGREAAARLLTARGEPLAGLLADLTDADRERLTAVLEQVLAKVYARVGDTERVCRLCDRTICTNNAECPVGAAAREAAEAGR
ncbi:MAG TPA: MarR family transcriptional regulator [Actinophytocola sp.]|uniref:MarR family winged helix-turn-helix transcriptional regulator n=1 Tax=Actinophytocola sp. TaxID=1872138 RepID=UPI002F934E38